MTIYIYSVATQDSIQSCGMLQRRKLDAVYYYMRSLAASNPFLTARESLMSLFDEARKKVNYIMPGFVNIGLINHA